VITHREREIRRDEAAQAVTDTDRPRGDVAPPGSFDSSPARRARSLTYSAHAPDVAALASECPWPRRSRRPGEAALGPRLGDVVETSAWSA